MRDGDGDGLSDRNAACRRSFIGTVGALGAGLGLTGLASAHENGDDSGGGSDEDSEESDEDEASEGNGEDEEVEAAAEFDFEDLDDWSGGSAYTEDPYRGDQSIELEAGEQASNDLDDPIDLDGYGPAMAVRVEDTTDAGDVFVRLVDSDGNSVRFERQINPDAHATDWHELTFGPSAESEDAPDLTEIEEVVVGVEDMGPVQFDDLQFVTAGGPYVLWRFDDSVASQVEFQEVVEEYDQVANYATITGVIGRDEYLDEEDLEAFDEAGSEIVSHYTTTATLDSQPDSVIRDNLEEAKEWLLEHGYEEGAKTFVYPGGRYRNSAVDIVGDFHELGSLVGGTSSPLAAPNPLLLNSFNAADESASRIKRAIDLAVEYDQVVTVYAHDTEELPQDTFEEAVAYVDDLDVPVVTFSELLEERADLV